MYPHGLAATEAKAPLQQIPALALGPGSRSLRSHSCMLCLSASSSYAACEAFMCAGASGPRERRVWSVSPILYSCIYDVAWWFASLACNHYGLAITEAQAPLQQIPAEALDPG